jgi:hypothetical protein
MLQLPLCLRQLCSLQLSNDDMMYLASALHLASALAVASAEVCLVEE